MGMRGVRPLLAFFCAAIVAAVCWSPCVLAAQLNSNLGVSVQSERVLSGLDYPSSAAFLPDGRMVILQLGGGVLLWDGSGQPRPAGAVEVEMDGERGLLGLAVDPLFEQTGRLYLYYSVGGKQRVGYAVLDRGNGTLGKVTDLVTELAADRDHNGGGIAFGPDGLLYFGTGDSGCSRSRAPGDGENYLASCLSRLEGKISRIDRDGGVPKSNPLVDASAVIGCPLGSSCEEVRSPLDAEVSARPRAEIYNWGLRNPWRFSFDEQTGYLWIGDVGEVTWEEITVSTGPSQHHGWPWREGVRGASNFTCAQWTPISGDCVEPVFAYSHFEEPADGQGAVVGGVFTNHCSWPATYRGNYWFGDFTKNRIWMLAVNSERTGVVGERMLVMEDAGGPVHFLTGPDGTLYYLAHLAGELWALRPGQPVDCEMAKASNSRSSSSAGGQAASPDSGTGSSPQSSSGGCACDSSGSQGRLDLLLFCGFLVALARTRRARSMHV